MKDLTKGSISSHLIAMAVPMAAGMIFQTLYFFVDLYFVAQLGDAAVAGVSTAGNAMFIIMAMTQVLGVGTVALIARNLRAEPETEPIPIDVGGLSRYDRPRPDTATCDDLLGGAVTP